MKRRTFEALFVLCLLYLLQINYEKKSNKENVKGSHYALNALFQQLEFDIFWGI